MEFELFNERLETIKDLKKLFDRAFKKMVESNPFVQDASGVPADVLNWQFFEHLKTLFAAVRPEALERGPLPVDADEDTLKNIAKCFGYSNVEKLKKWAESTTALDEFLDYYIYEGDFGGSISINEKEYDLKDNRQLYEYLKVL